MHSPPSSEHQLPYTSYNKWFLFPFMLWVVVGGLAQLIYSQQTLFALVNTHHTPLLDAVMVLITRMGEGVFGAIILVLVLVLKSYRNWWFVAAAFLCNVLPAVLTQIIKSAINAPRPLTVFKGQPWIHRAPEWEELFERSFPSGHTCAAFCLYTFLAIVLTPKYKWLGLVFFILAMAVGYSRLYLAAHFFVDAYVGSIIGVAFTILVVHQMRKYPHYFYRKRRTEAR